MNLRSYISENEFKIIVLNKRINISNYISIESFDSYKIIIKYSEGLLIINGSELTISTLLKDEVLIRGVIDSLEFR